MVLMGETFSVVIGSETSTSVFTSQAIGIDPAWLSLAPGSVTIHRMPNLGLMLKQARKAKRLLQSDVSAKLKLKSPQAVSDWETNAHVPEGAHMSALIDLYEMDETAALLAWARVKTGRLVPAEPGPTREEKARTAAEVLARDPEESPQPAQTTSRRRRRRPAEPPVP